MDIDHFKAVNDTFSEGGRVAAEKIRKAMKAAEWGLPDRTITLSIGVAVKRAETSRVEIAESRQTNSRQ